MTRDPPKWLLSVSRYCALLLMKGGAWERLVVVPGSLLELFGLLLGRATRVGLHSGPKELA